MGSESEFTPLTGDEEEVGCCRKVVRAIRPCLAEFIGVAIFVFIGCLSVQDKNPIAIAVAHGLAIVVLVALFGHVSGGHFNPAVTLGIVLSGAISPLKAILYVVSQLLGAVVGACFVRLVLDTVSIAGTTGSTTAYALINGGVHAVNPNVHVAAAILVEIVITSVLVMTVLITAVDAEGKSPSCPLYIGLAVVTGALAAFNSSGGSMNPARSFGPAVVLASGSAWTAHYVYWIGPGLGAVLAACLYKSLFATDNSRSGCCGK